MPASYNNATFVGNLGRDPELRYTPTGNPICGFSMAVNNRKKVNNEWVDDTLWVKVNVWGKQAEACSQYLSKGRPVLVSGPINVETWTDKDNNTRWNVVVNANQVTFLGDKPTNGPTDRPPTSSKPPVAPPAEPDISDEDIPF
jgi:single-strand DNA-binding protein